MTPEVKKDYMRQYRLAHPERMVNYARKSSANKRAREYGAPGELTLSDVESVMSSGRCFYCESTKKLGIDHVIPLHIGGPNRSENIVCCCHYCNQSKRRADRPGRWSQLYDECQQCGTNAIRHWCRGLCRRCYRQSTRTSGKYKSRVRVYVKAPPNLVCARCGIDFHLKPSSIRKDRGRYCSLRCRKTPVITRPCQWCTAPITISQRRIDEVA